MSFHKVKINLEKGLLELDDKKLTGVTEIKFSLKSDEFKGQRGQVTIVMDADVEFEGIVAFKDDMNKLKERG